MSNYRSPEIAKLAAQLLRSPRRLVFRELCGIEFVLSVIDADHAYPLDFIVHALTGYQAPARGQTSAESPLLDADTIRADLIVLAEELSSAAELEAGCWPERLYTVAELAERFDVSTKTIFRWHRRGLIGWRVRMADRRARLVFPERCVRRFVAANAVLVARGASFSQLTQAERTRIVERARELAAEGEPSVNAVARVIAAESGRAVETIRLILKSYDRAHPRAGVFNRSRLDVEPDDERLQIWEAHQDGASVAALCKRFGRSARALYRTLTEMRARDLKARKIEFVPNDEFYADDADETILGDPAAASPYNGTTPKRRIPAGLPPYLEQLFRLPLLTPEGERALFRKFNYLKFKADRARAAIDPERATARELDAIERLLAEADAVKRQIVEANLRLVVSIAKRHASYNRDFFEIVSDGNVSLMRAVDKFDYGRGFKFSTYASWAIIRNYARTVPEHKHHYDRYQTGRDEFLEHVASESLEEQESDYLPAVRDAVDRMLAILDDREQAILRQRFGLGEHREPHTLEQIGRSFGVSKERIRQLEARAMNKLRAGFSADIEKILAG